MLRLTKELERYFSNNIVKESVKVKLRKGEEEILEEFKIENVELIKGHYEDSIDDDDIKLEIDLKKIES